MFLQIGFGKGQDLRSIPGPELTAHGAVVRGVCDLFMDEELMTGYKTSLTKPQVLHLPAHVLQHLTGADALQIVRIVNAYQKRFLHRYSAETDTLAARISSPSSMASANSSLTG